MVGSAIHRKLIEEGYNNLVMRSSRDLDLLDLKAVSEFFKIEKPDYVMMAAAKVGGILANDKYQGQFIYENVVMQSNVIHLSHVNKVKKLLFLGSSCIYPKMAPQPIKEEYLLTGTLEPTNQSYAIAKIAGLEMCKAYRMQYGSNFVAVMPTNIYGFNDNYNPETAHVLPALIRKFHDAKESGASSVEIWGTGEPLREFLHVDDLADACYHIMLNYDDAEIINIGSGEELTIKELSELIKSVVGYDGELIFDHSKPDGTPAKALDSTKLHKLGWKRKISLSDGIREVYEDFLNSEVKI